VGHGRIRVTLPAVRLFHARRSATFLAILAGACAGCADGRHTLRGENQAPLGVLEEPREGTTASPSFKVRGWAGDDRGIRAVRVFLDGELIGLAEFASDRADVTTVYPLFRHGTDRHGWEKTVETAPGPHTIRVEAVDTDGATSDLGTRRLVVSDHSS